MEIHLKDLPLLRKEVSSFRKKYEAIRDNVKKEYSEDFRTPLRTKDLELLKIELVGLLEYVYSLIATGLQSLPNPSTLIYAKLFPDNLKLKIKIRKEETYINRAFTIGRGDDDCIWIRQVPFRMSLEDLIEKAESASGIKEFPVFFKSQEKIEREEYKVITSRIHVVIYYDDSYFRIIDVSNSGTIVEIDGDAQRLVGYRARPYMPLLSLPLGEKNKLWIDPIKGAEGTPIEITIVKD
ncbi:MAG: hypothetical protein QXX41_14940 [Nitrososphaerota archaeon]